MFTRTKKRSEEEIRLEQELINATKLYSEHTQAIQTLNHGQMALASKTERVLNKAESDHKTLSIQFEKLKESVESFLVQMDQRLGNMETHVSGLMDGFLKIKKEIQSDCVHRDDLNNSLECHRDKLECLQQEVSMQKDGFNSAIVALNHRIKEETAAVKKDLTVEPPEVCPIQSKVDEVSQVWKVDFEGLIKEIAILKKSSMYAEKKFENIYTLIDRLKSDGGGLFHKQA